VNVTEPVADPDDAAVGQGPVGESHCQHWFSTAAVIAHGEKRCSRADSYHLSTDKRWLDFPEGTAPQRRDS
jgi:hypothetical protein